jgi:uncharacterized protein (TIGR00375 family)
MYVADLHIHSKYSRATSEDMTPEVLAAVAEKKGVNLLGTGDILHPMWRRELVGILREEREGIYRFKRLDFILTTEVSLVYSQGNTVRKVHIVLVFPDFETVERVAKRLSLYGNLEADGRPTFGLTLPQFIDVIRGVSSEILLIPAHVWTPWFSIFGSNSGFDSLDEALSDKKFEIIALETGLSSDPPMNWRWSHLDDFPLVSNSDAHSPWRIGREANVFSEPFDFPTLKEILRKKDKNRFLFTIEFFPEEGKYHYDGHRNCGIRLSPKESKRVNNVCPVCGRPLTVGVLHRVEDLADRPEGYVPDSAINYRRLVPLDEIVAEALGIGSGTQKVKLEMEKLLSQFKSELEILLSVPEYELEKRIHPRVAKGIINVRRGRVKVEPGYDGVYGTVQVFPEGEEEPQMSLF